MLGFYLLDESAMPPEDAKSDHYQQVVVALLVLISFNVKTMLLD